ncbi:MAG TPA: LUD domain-containing protein [bacterium]|nr:LUD domain-containing protein [bacterium]HPR89563.1 LUD domain-containing protein [bacterium]
MSHAREAILARVRAALEHPSHLPEAPEGTAARIEAAVRAATPADVRGLATRFKRELETVSGECYVLSSSAAAADKLAELLQAAPAASLALDGDPLSRAAAAALPDGAVYDASALPPAERRSRLAETAAGVVTADFGLADTGSLVIRFTAGRSGWAGVLPETIYALLPSGRLLPTFQALAAQPDAAAHRNMVLITGPSRTADIEKILILGAHGPRRLVVLITME